MNETYIPGFSNTLRSGSSRRFAVGGRADNLLREGEDLGSYDAPSYYQPTPQPVQAAPTSYAGAEEVDPYTGLTKAETDAQIAALLSGSVDVGNLGIVPEWEQFRAPSYSAPVMEYLSSLDKYIIENDPSFGMMYSKAPTVDLSTPEKVRQYSLYGIGDFLPEEQVAAYMNKPFEQNVGFTVAPTEAGVGKNVTGALDVAYDTPIILRDDATGEIVYQGTGFAGAQEAARLSNQLSATGDKKTQWSLMTGAPGATDISQFKTVAQDKPDYLGGVLGALVQYGLPIGLSLIPGVGWAGSAALAGAGSTAGKLISGYDLGDALKSGLITAGTAGLLKAPILSGGSSIGGAIGDVVGKIPGVGDALKAVTPSGSYVDAAGDIVVRGALASPLVEGVASSLLGSGAFAPDYSGLGKFADPSYTGVQAPTQQPTGGGGYNAPAAGLDDAGNLITVTGSKLPSSALDSALAAAAAAPGTVNYGDKVFNQPEQPLAEEEEEQPGWDVVAPKENLVVPPPASLPEIIPPLASVTIPPLAGTELPNVPEQPPAEEEQPGWDVVANSEPRAPNLLPEIVPPLSSVDIPANAGNVTPTEDKGGLSTSDYIRLASLGLSTIGKLFGGSGQQQGATISGNMSGLNPVFSKQLPTANIPGLTAATAGARAPSQSGLNTTQDWYRYGYGPEQSFFNYVPMAQRNTSQAYTGYAEGGFAVEGAGDGRDDKIPAMLSDGEYVIDAETVALLGNGSNKAGADLLDKFRVNVRKHKGQQLAKGEFSDDAKRPEHYLAGGRM